MKHVEAIRKAWRADLDPKIQVVRELARGPVCLKGSSARLAEPGGDGAEGLW
ncbi:hypothetical protein ACIRPT_05860 [Streptomyces sp. NPDC101227]|uniref:hypothetical protein n=1 Tax=Streptomyces sp. NPDC101227 TaxID=3366136 RepID=UPI0038231D5F